MPEGASIPPRCGHPADHLSTTFERSASGEYPLGYSYAREGNPTRHALEVCLADLEEVKRRWHFPLDWRWLRR